MKKLLSFFGFLLLTGGNLVGQNQNMEVVTSQEPYFPKGEQALYTEVLMNIDYPEEARKNSLAGEVMLSFDVMPDSTVNNVVILSGVGYGVDEEVKNYIEKLKFVPAIQNKVAVRMNLMMSFPVKAH